MDFSHCARDLRVILQRWLLHRNAVEALTGLADFAARTAQAYPDLSRQCGVDEADVAVRSSAMAEDLSQVSFAGQQESFLNITGEHLIDLRQGGAFCYR